MKGFMRRRGDAWELRVYLGGDPVTGSNGTRAAPCVGASAKPSGS